MVREVDEKPQSHGPRTTTILRVDEKFAVFTGRAVWRRKGENSEGGGGSSAIDVGEGARPIAGAECYEMPPLDARFRHFL